MPNAQMVGFPSGSEQLEAYLARPEGSGPLPGLVVIHEAFGLNDDIKEITQRFAAQGYVSLAVDLFAGRNRVMCMFRLFGGIFFNSLEHGGIRDLRAALDFLAAQPGVDSARVGAVGFCMGGSLAIAWSCTDDRLKAIAPFYSFNPKPLEAIQRACPVVGSFPERDPTTAQGKKLDEVLDQHKIPHDIKVYPGAAHSFFNAGRNFNPEAADDAWKRMLGFFSEHLQAR